MLFLWLCLCLFVLHTTNSDDAPIIKPNQLLIGTVIDTTNSEIVRDAVNFLKSVRLFGNTMNEASILVGITGSYEDCIVDSTLLPLLADMGVEVVFITQTVKYAKTLNKFKIFDLFDSTKYDYFLWLDADIIVFDDPMLYLHMHMYPGEIECVPDFYSYMRRFPSVNMSAEYWNPSLATIRLLGEYESAPSGLCNTGLLYFDSLSLSNFREGLHTIMNNRTFLDAHGGDRFVDSLIFTKVVQDLALDVSILPYKLNYMALFEIEIREEAPVADIVMAHLVSDTELYCVTSPAAIPDESEPCSCVYRNKLLPSDGSVLRDTIQAKLLSSSDICHLFAGVGLPALPPGVPHRPALGVPPQYNSFYGDTLGRLNRAGLLGCELLSPSGTDWVLFTSRERDSSTTPQSLIDVSIGCSVSRIVMDAAQHIVHFIVSNDVLHGLNQRVVHQSKLYVSTATEVPCVDEVCTIHIHYSVELIIPEDLVQAANPVDPHANFSLQIGVGLNEEAQQASFEINSSFTVVFENLQSPGQVHYSTNLFLGAKSIAFESQLLLPQFLNARNMRGTGVVACCDTHKGVTTVERLIKHWRGDHLFIIAERIPPAHGKDGPRDDTLKLLAESFRQHCNKRMDTDRSNNKFMCHISVASSTAPTSTTDHGVSFTRRLVTALRTNSVQFVYSDTTVLAFAEQQALLSEYMRVLSKGGVLTGTQFASGHRRCSSDFEWNGPLKDGDDPACNRTVLRNNAHEQTKTIVTSQRGYDNDHGDDRRALDSLLWKLSLSVLLTHGERDPHFCDTFVRRRLNTTSTSFVGAPNNFVEAASVECAPAWYLFKQRNVW